MRSVTPRQGHSVQLGLSLSYVLSLRHKEPASGVLPIVEREGFLYTGAQLVVNLIKPATVRAAMYSSFLAIE